MSRIRTALVVCALALPIPAAIAGCGGDDSSSSDEDPQTVLDETFNNDTKVTSGDLQLNASLSAEGDQGGQLDVSLGGPFQGDPNDENAIPQLDWTASLSGQGAGQSIDFSGGLVVTDDNAYVEYKDQAVRGRREGVQQPPRPTRVPGVERQPEHRRVQGAVRDRAPAGGCNRHLRV